MVLVQKLEKIILVVLIRVTEKINEKCEYERNKKVIYLVVVVVVEGGIVFLRVILPLTHVL